MKRIQKTPLRKCVITQERHPKQALIRIVKNNEGEVFIDPTGKQNGRGAYLKRSRSVIEKARKTKKLDRHLKMSIDQGIYDALLAMLDDE